MLRLIVCLRGRSFVVLSHWPKHERYKAIASGAPRNLNDTRLHRLAGYGRFPVGGSSDSPHAIVVLVFFQCPNDSHRAYRLVLLLGDTE